MGAKQVSTQKLVKFYATPAVELKVLDDANVCRERYILDLQDARDLGKALLQASGKVKREG